MRRKFFTLLLISFSFFLIDYLKLSPAIRNPAEPVIVESKKIIYKGFYQLKFLPDIFMNYRQIVEGIDEGEKLKRETRQIKLELAGLTAENESLRRQLGAPLLSTFRFIPAEVIAVSRYMEVSAGLMEGVKKGMSVVDGITLIGRVSEVTARRSQVQLLTDRDLEIPVITNRGTRGKTAGQLSELVLFKSILQKDPLFLEDILTTTGEDGFPPKLLIGTISYIDSDDAQVYKQAQIKPFINYKILKKVFIVDET